ncbi:MAG: S41 family peptidase [Bacteroidales bacterium]|nr:S41 family peptidase [Bacteroidales bacterium]
MKLLKYILIGAVALNIVACDDDDKNDLKKTDPTKNNNVISATTIEANRFVYEIMADYYYWYNLMPNINYKLEKNTEDFFEKLKYSGDRFSFITDDAEAYKKEESGISTSKGWNTTFMLYEQGSDRVITMINYVYHNTPAELAGAKRGDIILTVNGKEQNKENYYDLFNESTTKYAAKRYNEKTQKYEDVEYTITSAEITTSPVAEHSVFETEAGKVGYLLYLDYYSEFNTELTSVFNSFKEAGIKDLILDLRYNPGGEMLAMRHLCSLIAPQENVANKDLLIWYDFNNKLNKLGGYDKASNATYFNSDLASNTLGLNRIIIITGSSTYSASESTIIGLEPYMEVYTIGATTGGKNTSMFIMTPDLFTDTQNNKPYFDSSINNWLIAPIVAVYYNANDKTFDPSNGIDPDFELKEYSFDYLGTLGDENEPLTAAAIEFIETGNIETEANKALNITRPIIKHDDKLGGSIIEIPTINK